MHFRKRNSAIKITFKTLFLISFSILLSACAGIVPMPGGSDTINKGFYESDVDMRERVASLEVGMPKSEVFEILGRTEDDFILLSRDEIVSTLYGGVQSNFAFREAEPLYDRELLKSLDGYKLVYKNVKRKHGVSSPIAMRTNEVGYSYVSSFIFKDDILYEKPVLSGGTVDASSSKTISDYLSPEKVMGHVGV